MEAFKNRHKFLEILHKTLSTVMNDYEIIEAIPNEKGEGYMGEIFQIVLKTQEKRHQLVLKAAFTNEMVRAVIPIRHSYENEIFFYTQLYNTFLEIAPDLGAFTPKCLATSVADAEEMLILENLQPQGFEVYNKKLIFTHEHVKLIFDTYGKLHGYSFVYKKKNPEGFLQATNTLYNVFEELKAMPNFIESFTQLSQFAEAVLVTGADDAVIEKYRKYSGEKLFQVTTELMTRSSPYNVILHGDCWSNNMLFKYKNEIPAEIKLIDFQFLRLGNPVCDLSYILYSGASKTCFDNVAAYRKIWYNSFSSFVRSAGEDPEDLYPYAAFEADWQAFAITGLLMSLGILKLKLTEKEDVMDLTDISSDEDFTQKLTTIKFDKEEYDRRIKDLLYHLHEIDAL